MSCCVSLSLSHCCQPLGCCVQVKRKDPPEAASAGDNKRARPSTPVDDELEVPVDDSKADADALAAKRRHSRPAELDSEGEEEEEEEADTSEKEEEESDREEEADIREAAERLLAAKVSQLSLCVRGGQTV